MSALLTRLWSARRVIAIYAVLVALGWFVGEYLMGLAIPEMRPMDEPSVRRLVMAALVFFVLTAALPFVPGAEIGFTLLLLFGAEASPLVYFGMVGALVLSYSVARLVPLPLLVRFTRWLGLTRAADFAEELAAKPRPQRTAFVADTLNGRFSASLFSNRYIVLALLLNLPGNSVLGGGGGLAFLAGVSGLYGFWRYLTTVLLAVAPFPVLFLILGS